MERYPNVRYLGLTEENLLTHPLYKPIIPYKLNLINNSINTDFTDYTFLSDNPYIFPQNTKEWEFLHYGRITGSSSSFAMGLYESQVTSILKIPHSIYSNKSFNSSRYIYY